MMSMFKQRESLTLFELPGALAISRPAVKGASSELQVHQNAVFA